LTIASLQFAADEQVEFLVGATQLDVGPRESSGLATELVRLLESVGDPDLTVSLSVAPLTASLQGGKIAAALQLAERVIELTDGKPTEGELMTISPLASALSLRGTGRWALGLPGWREDLDRALEVVAAIPPTFRSGTFWHVYLYTIPNGVLLAGPTAVDSAAEIHSAAEQFGERITVDLAGLPVASPSSTEEGQSETPETDCSRSCMTPRGGSAP
jgi:adenylate cyclase